jgi:predicted RNase H-like HicB family nuclease
MPDIQTVNLDVLRLRLTAVYEPAPEGGYTCRFEELPEVFSEGENIEEAKSNLLDALNQVMEYHREEARKNSSHLSLPSQVHPQPPLHRVNNPVRS